MVGAGGGVPAVPFMTACNVEHPQLPSRRRPRWACRSRVAGTVGFIVAGLGQPGMPPHTLGLRLPAGAARDRRGKHALAPIGARAAHRWPVKKLKRAFALLLYVLAAYMLWKAWR